MRPRNKHPNKASTRLHQDLGQETQKDHREAPAQLRGSIYLSSNPWRCTRWPCWYFLAAIVLSPLLLVLGPLYLEGTLGVSSDETTHNSEAYPQQLDYGIYWFGPGNVCEKAKDGVCGRFDPSKPSVLYVHGFQKTVVGRGFRETFNYYYNYGRNPGESRGCDPELWDHNAADAWIAAGWNVGAFYWNQFADDDDVADVEAKVWSDAGRHGLRWCRRRDEGDRRVCYEPVPHDFKFESIGELLCHEVLSQFNCVEAPSVRLVGHSTGAQLVVHAAGLLLEQGLHVQRLALLDPFCSNRVKQYLNGSTPAQETLRRVRALGEQGTAIEVWETSIVSDPPLALIGSSAAAYRPFAACFQLEPPNFGWFHFFGRHISAPCLYWLSYGEVGPALTEVRAGSDTVCRLPLLGQCGDGELLKLMREPCWWRQVDGRVFERMEL